MAPAERSLFLNAEHQIGIGRGFDRVPGRRDDPLVERAAVRADAATIGCDLRHRVFRQFGERHLRMQKLRHVHQLRPARERRRLVQQVAAADDFFEVFGAELAEQLPHLLGDAHQVRLGMLRLSFVFALRAGDSGRAIRNVAAFADDATHRHHECLAKAEFVGPEQGVLDDVVARLDAARRRGVSRLWRRPFRTRA